MREAADRLQELSKQKAELDQVWDMLARAMSVIDDLTNLRPPCARTQQAIDDLIEGIHELEGPQE
jgi:predicted Zn-dependent protease